MTGRTGLANGEEAFRCGSATAAAGRAGHYASARLGPIPATATALNRLSKGNLFFNALGQPLPG